VEGFWGTVMIMSLSSFPLAYLPVEAALKRISLSYEEVSLSLGCRLTKIRMAKIKARRVCKWFSFDNGVQTASAQCADKCPRLCACLGILRQEPPYIAYAV
ncbi:hypothetical protein I7S30_06350, partial [Neisseria meningitidis]|nr:hypothetical protein [Neisseria meningitidis]